MRKGTGSGLQKGTGVDIRKAKDCDVDERNMSERKERDGVG